MTHRDCAFQEGLGNNRLSTGVRHSHGHMSIGNSEASRRFTQDEVGTQDAAAFAGLNEAATRTEP